jgi:hypothetical protein
MRVQEHIEVTRGHGLEELQGDVGGFFAAVAYEDTPLCRQQA